MGRSNKGFIGGVVILIAIAALAGGIFYWWHSDDARNAKIKALNLEAFKLGTDVFRDGNLEESGSGYIRGKMLLVSTVDEVTPEIAVGPEKYWSNSPWTNSLIENVPESLRPTEPDDVGTIVAQKIRVDEGPGTDVECVNTKTHARTSAHQSIIYLKIIDRATHAVIATKEVKVAPWCQNGIDNTDDKPVTKYLDSLPRR